MSKQAKQLEFEYREEYLTELCAMILDSELLPHMPGDGEAKRPPYRVSVGWPKGVRGGRKAIAQCWPRAMSDDGVNEIFVSPITDDIDTLAHTLQHELIHAIDDNVSGHRGFFAIVAKASGLQGKMTATIASVSQARRLKEITDLLGAYPHKSLNDSLRKKQSTRMLKFYCAGCGFVARTSGRWITAVIGTNCPNCGDNTLTSDDV